jgi:hypothetical protein
MSKTEAISWKRLTAEGVAVVVSILLAFSIDAWWQNRQEHADERVVLESIASELRQLAEQFERSQHYVNALRESARTLLLSSGNPDISLSDKEIDTLLADLTWYTAPNQLPTPELDSLISSGDISLISNFSLRRRLAVLPASLNRLRSATLRSNNFFNNEFMPYLARNASIQQIYNADDYQPGFPNNAYPDDTYYAWSLNKSHTPLLDDNEFQSLLAIRLGNFDEYLEWASAGILEQVEQTIELLEEELTE